MRNRRQAVHHLALLVAACIVLGAAGDAQALQDHFRLQLQVDDFTGRVLPGGGCTGGDVVFTPGGGFWWSMNWIIHNDGSFDVNSTPYLVYDRATGVNYDSLTGEVFDADVHGAEHVEVDRGPEIIRQRWTIGVKETGSNGSIRKTLNQFQFVLHKDGTVDIELVTHFNAACVKIAK